MKNDCITGVQFDACRTKIIGIEGRMILTANVIRDAGAKINDWTYWTTVAADGHRKGTIVFSDGNQRYPNYQDLRIGVQWPE